MATANLDDKCAYVDAPKPEGNCGIIYSKCNFKGCSQTICGEEKNFPNKIIPK